MRLLVTLLAYTIGIFIGTLIHNNNYLFILLTVPALAVFLILEKKQRGTDKFIKDVEKTLKLPKEEQEEAWKKIK